MTAQSALVILKALCRLESVTPPRYLSDALVRARELLVAMAQLGRVREERDSPEAERDASRSTLTAAVKGFEDSMTVLARHHKDLTTQPTEVAGRVQGEAPQHVDLPLASARSGADDLQLLSFKRPRL